MSTELTPPDRTYRNDLIRITDLSVTEDVLTNLTFQSCQIVGPAVLALLGGVTMDRCSFESDEIMWEIHPPARIYGAIGLLRCEFYGCRFTRIGLAVDPALAARFREMVTGQD